MKRTHSAWSGREPSTSGRCCNHVFILGLLLFLGLQVAHGTSFTCPTVCTCTVWTTTIAGTATKVQNITCRNVNLTSVPADAKKGADVIKLDLSRNKLVSLVRTDVQYFSNLEWLDLSFNNISSIDADVFSNLTSLQYLNLAGNLNLGFPLGIFDDSLILYLNSSHLQLTTIPSTAFDALTQIRTIYLDNNRITEISRNMFASTTIQEINLSQNQITTISKDAFRNALNVTNISTLISLNISYNLVTSLDGKLLDTATELRWLDLRNNQLQVIPAGFLTYSPKLEYIDLRHNNLTTLSNTLLDGQTATLSLYLSGNQYLCDCTVREFLYAIYYDTRQTLVDQADVYCDDTNGDSQLYLDWQECTNGALGSACAGANECFVLSSTCSNGVCACASLYYDNNGDTTAGGLCKPKQRLDFLCDMDSACEANFSECRLPSAASTTLKCLCMAGYYDNNPMYLGGTCLPQVALGNSCTMDQMCITNNSYCGMTNKCVCQSAYYDNNTDSVMEGECLPKIPLYLSCNASYQCRPDNAECSAGKCSCKSSYYDFDNSGACYNAAQFFSCFPRNDSNQAIDFSHSTEFINLTLCQEFCFSNNARYYQNHQGVCLCGNKSTASCCPYVTNCNGRMFLDPGTDYVTAGIVVRPIPLLYMGVSHTFQVTTNLSTIDQIIVDFGDTDTVYTFNATTVSAQHAYTRWGQFNISVDACGGSVCDKATIPVRVQVLPSNMDFWTSGPLAADVALGLSSQTQVTFQAGYNFEYYWSRTDSSGTQVKRRQCVSGWTAHRHSCIKLYTTSLGQTDARTACTIESAKLLKLNFAEEMSEVSSLTGVNNEQIWTDGWTTGGVWQWKSDTSKTFFGTADLTSSTAGSCVVLDTNTRALTTASCTSSHKYVCRKDPVDCPYGGTKLSNDNCVVLATSLMNYNNAQTACVSTYKGWLVNITSAATQQAVSSLLQSNSIQYAWFGLSDRIHEGYYTWTDFSSFDMGSSTVYKPTISENLYDCFATSDSSTWRSNSCEDVLPSVCEYSINRQRKSVPVYVAGTPDIEMTTGTSLTAIEKATTVFSKSVTSASTVSTEILLFPGMWFARSGKVHSLMAHTSAIPAGQSYNVSLQVYSPVCTGSNLVIQPGCQPSRFASCASSGQTCPSSTACKTDQTFCYYSGACKRTGKSCTCNSENLSADPKCTTSGTMPSFQLRGKADVTFGSGENFYSMLINNAITVFEHDVVGLQFETGKNPIHCLNRTGFSAQQTVYRAPQTGWLEEQSFFPSSAGITYQDLTCFFHVNYVQEMSENIPQDVGGVDRVGLYHFSVTVVDTETKTFSSSLIEPISNVEFIYPPLSVTGTSTGLFGTVYLEYNQSYDLTVRVAEGTDILDTWVLPSSSSVASNFSSSCPSMAAASVPQLCNYSLVWSDKPYTYVSYTPSTLGSKNITLTLVNKLGTVGRTLMTSAEKRITGLSLSLLSQSLLTSNIAVNRQTTFQASVTDGTAITYAYTVNGTSIATSNSTLFYNCTTVGTKVVSVNVSNILGSVTANQTVYCKQRASFVSCSFVNLPFSAATTLPFRFRINCTVTVGAEVNSLWEFSDRSGNATTSVVTTTGTYHVFEYSATFANAANSLTVVGIVQDPFEQVRLSTTVTVYNKIPSVTVSNMETDILVGTNIALSAAVPASPGNYGTVVYKVDYGNAVNETMVSGSSSHTFSTPGQYNVTVYAVSEASGVSQTFLVTVYTTISGLTFTYDGPNEVQTATLFTATTLTGNYLSFRFTSSVFNYTQSGGVFSFNFTVPGDYVVTVSAFNHLTNMSTSLTAIVLASTEIRMTNLTVDGQSPFPCINTSKNYTFEVTAVHYNMGALMYKFDMGNNVVTAYSTSSSVTKSYPTAGNFTINATATNTAQNFGSSIQREICVQEVIQNPVINVTSPLGLPGSGSLLQAVGVTVSAGSSMKYTWETNATFSGQIDAAGTVWSISGEGTYSLSVNVSNAVSSRKVTVVVEVVKQIEGLTISCSSCTIMAGNYYIRNNTAVNVFATTSSGVPTSYKWSLGDGTDVDMTNSVSHTYPDVGRYNVTLNVSNTVSSNMVVTVAIHVEVPLTSVIVSNYQSAWKDNKRSGGYKNLAITDEGVFQAVSAPGNMELTYYWTFEQGEPEEITTTNIGRHNFTSKGHKTCSVIAKNSINNVTSTQFNFYVIQPIVDIFVSVGQNQLSNVTNNIIGKDINYTFVMTSPQVVEGTEEYFFRVKNYSMLLFSSGLDKTINSYTQGIGIEANYTLEARLENALLAKSQLFTLEVVERLSGAFITAPSGEDGNITVGSSITLTGGVTAGKYPQYHWFFAVAPAGTAFPSPTNQPSVTLTLSTVGQYIVTVEIFNSVSQTQSANYTINVMEGVYGVVIANNLGITNAVSKGSIVQFTAQVAGGTGLLYSWQIDRSGNIEATGVDQTLTFTFSKQSLYNITLFVENFASSEEVFSEIYSLVPVPSFVINFGSSYRVTSLQKLAASSSTDLTFYSNLTNTDFLSFDWKVDNVSLASTNTMVHSFVTPATYTVSLTVENLISTSSNSIEVLIQDPISGFTIVNCNTTHAVNSLVTMTSSTATGTDVNFKWKRQTFTDSDGSSVSAVYTTPGEYSVNITASNYVSTQELYCIITIQGVIDNLVINKPLHAFANYGIRFTMTGDNLSPATFEWTLSNGDTKTTSSPSVSFTVATKGLYNVSVKAENDVSSSTATLTFDVIELSCTEPVLTVSAPTNRLALRSRSLDLAVEVSTGTCTSYTSVNKWTVYKAASCSSPLTTEYTLPSTVNVNTPNLYIPKVTLEYGSYCFIFENSYLNTPVTVSTGFNVTVEQSSLNAKISGGDERTQSAGSSLEISAMESSDPDDKIQSSTFTYTWTCSQSMGTPASAYVCQQIEAMTTGAATLNGLTLNQNDVFIIGVVVSAVNRVQGTAHQKIVIAAAGAPMVGVICMSCLANGHDNLANDTQVAILGSCNTSATFNWQVQVVGGVALPLTSGMTTTGTSSKNLVIKADYLDNSLSYKLTLSANNSAGTGYASITLAPSSVPSGGSCSITGGNIVPLQDKITVTCSNWQDSDPQSGIYYKVVATNGNEVIPLSYGIKSENSIYISPLPNTGYAPVPVKVFVINDNGISVLGGYSVITFAQPTLSGNQLDNVDFIIDMIKAQMPSIVKENNPSDLIQFCNALILFLNEQSSNNVGTVEERLTIRNLIATALYGIPRNVYDIQPLAAALWQLSEYNNEMSPTVADLINVELQNLTSLMQANVQQGQDPKDVNTDYLLAAVDNIQTNLINGTAYTTDSNTLASLGDLSEYVLAISDNHTVMLYATEAERKQEMIQSSQDLNTELLIVQLKAMLPDEEFILKNVSGTLFTASHVSRLNIASSFNLTGVKMFIPANILSFTSYTGDSAYQLLIASPLNSLDFGYGTSAVNTKTIFASFYRPDGSRIVVENLASDKVGMYLFQNATSAYNISDMGLIQTIGYNPLASGNFTDTSIAAGSTYTTSSLSKITTAALNYMVRVGFAVTESSSSNVTATLYKNGHAYTSSNTLTSLHPKVITPAMMSNLQHSHLDYTFFVPQGSFDSDDQLTIQVNIHTRQSVNVSLSQFFTTCSYFNTISSAWETAGCVPTEKSIHEVIHCECNHMTSYGGAILVSPDRISFTDLANLDIASNPVAIITCSVILFVYIVAVIACRRMDILDIKRISIIPLCGKDGSFKYEVTVVTGRMPGAGTTANVGIRICGEYGKSARQHIVKEGAFKRNSMDTFIVAYDVNLGDLRKVNIWHDNSGLSPSWYLSYVIVYDLQTDQKYYFFANSWLSLEVENGSIEKEMLSAGPEEMNQLGHRFSVAMFNSLADKHLWLSLLNRPAQSRFTRVQRITCCVTLLFTFIGVNAMWYGLLKRNNTDIGFGDFGWEEMVLALISNLMVFPINLGLVFLFKKSRSKPNMLDTVQKPQTAQTLEIENLCGNSQGGSFESHNTGAIPYDLDRESTIDSVPAQRVGLRRSRHVTKTQRENTDDSMCLRPMVAVTSTSAKNPIWTEDNILKWPESNPYENDSRPSTSSTVAPSSAGNQLGPRAGGSTSGIGKKKKEDSDKLLEELDKMDQDLKNIESRSVRSSRSNRSGHSVRKQSKASWEELEDILNSDEESVAGSSTRKHMKRGSTVSQSSISKRFNPRADPKINLHGSRWPQTRQSIVSSSTAIGDTFEPSTSQAVTQGLEPAYYSEMTMESRDQHQILIHKEKCTLPPWCVYVAYVLCFLLTAFSVIIVILYCFKFGQNEALEWLLACLLSLILSILVIEPVKAVVIAVYVVAMAKNVEQDEDDDYIDIEPTVDSSNEKIKDVKFKPISGFALVQAKDEGRKVHRMNVMLKQFFAYMFYLWLFMAIVFINSSYNTYLLHEKVENAFILTNSPNYVNYNNMTNIEQFWDWTDNVLPDILHLQETNTNEEHGYLLGAARLRLIRSKEVKCGAGSAANGLGASSLTARTCVGDNGYEEDEESYGEHWNESSYNRSWRHQSASELEGSYKIGMMGTYGGGGYAQILGTTKSQTVAILTDLKDKGWIDLQTRAVLMEFSIYSPGSDLTVLVAMLVEFPVTGGLVTSYEIQTQKLLWFAENHLSPIMILECILLLVVVYSSIHIVCRMREFRKKYFMDLWNWYEMLTTLMTIVSIGMYLGCVIEATNTFNEFLDNQSGFTNFEHVVYVHVGLRYLNAWILFLLMFKVVKQLRFIKFLHVYEKTLSKAVGLLLATALIFFLLLLAYAQVGNLMYGRLLPEFQTVGHSINTLLVIIRGTFDFDPMLDHRPAFSHFYLYSYYVFVYGLTIALIIAILNNMYRTTKSKMYFKSTLEMQDYEMIDFMLKRFKLWAGFQKPKPAFRRVRFPGLPSISSRSSSSYSNRSSDSLHSAQPLTGPDPSQLQLRHMMDRLTPTWQAVLIRFDKIVALDKEEEDLVKKAENEMKELNWKCRINQLEKEHKEILNWQKSGDSRKTAGISDSKQRQSILKTLASKDNQPDRKAPATVTGASRSSNTPPTKENKVTPGRRPLSDQGARLDAKPAKNSSSERSKLQSFLKSVKPSKPAWDK